MFSLATRNLFDDFLGLSEPYAYHNFNPRLELIRQDDKLVATMELPGVSMEDVRVELHNNAIVISGEKKASSGGKFWHGRFRESFVVPRNTSRDDVFAILRGGVLSVEVKLPEDYSEIEEIPIRGA